MEPHEFDWQTYLPQMLTWGVPIAAFCVGWLFGRRGSTAASATRICRSLNKIAAALEKPT